MIMLLVLIPVSLLLVGIAVWAFFWAAENGQFDDLDTPALSVLAEDAPQACATDAVKPESAGGDPR
jgi:cbb3-type cytochrome oxidase maturation protein